MKSLKNLQEGDKFVSMLSELTSLQREVGSALNHLGGQVTHKLEPEYYEVKENPQLYQKRIQILKKMKRLVSQMDKEHWKGFF